MIDIRYTQVDLAIHYRIIQSTVSKIINSLPSQPLQGINSNGMVYYFITLKI